MNSIDTPIDFMISLDWNVDDLEKSIKMLYEWDMRGKEYYKNVRQYVAKVDKAEREHLRNCIKFWQEKLKNEIKSS